MQRALGTAPHAPAARGSCQRRVVKGRQPCTLASASQDFRGSQGQNARQVSPLASLGHDSVGSTVSRRAQLQQVAAATAVVLAGGLSVPAVAQADYNNDRFTVTPSGLRYFDVKLGEGTAPEPGDTCVINWAGYTKGYQGKRFGNSSVEDHEPFEFVLGKGQAIAAIEEAVASMRAGGLRRVEIPGESTLGYPRDRSQRFTNERSLFSDKVFKYRYGPQPFDFFGQRALDFVLDNTTLQDFNRDLLFDIKLLAVRKAQ